MNAKTGRPWFQKKTLPTSLLKTKQKKAQAKLMLDFVESRGKHRTLVKRNKKTGKIMANFGKPQLRTNGRYMKKSPC